MSYKIIFMYTINNYIIKNNDFRHHPTKVCLVQNNFPKPIES